MVELLGLLGMLLGVGILWELSRSSNVAPFL